MTTIVDTIYSIDASSRCPLPLFVSPVEAGFPSPADDYLDQLLDLNEHLIKNPAATFLVRVRGDSMVDAGIKSGDMLIVDKSLDAADGDIVIATVDGAFTVKRYQKVEGRLRLVAESTGHRDIEFDNVESAEIWGVVIHVISTLRRR